MANEMVTSSQSSQTSTSFRSISILVVDDDTTCLSIVAAILKSWNYEVAKKKGKTIIEEIGSDEEMSVQETSQTDKGSNDDVESTSSANEYRKSTKESKRKTTTKDTNNSDKRENKDNCSTRRRQRLSGQMHSTARAVPKKILELMNVPGLTRENVASHLQQMKELYFLTSKWTSRDGVT
ncbi:hypothetical protein HYC85_001163 [Camellia sinensis]|uniref:Response regulatory domain-containing protein n=1 Tax=Camellia sinensis TaxID=4442 RepID=A0A7J7I6C4_CAMSI|nr:hypothetical protein HYC85_001163 [Camellia sinensis]